MSALPHWITSADPPETPFLQRRFSDVAKTPWGRTAWMVVNARENIIRMEMAASLKKAPVLGLGDPAVLAKVCRGELTNRRKQCLGSMVRQVMERLGWYVHATVKLPPGSIGSRAYTYRRYG